MAGGFTLLMLWPLGHNCQTPIRNAILCGRRPFSDIYFIFYRLVSLDRDPPPNGNLSRDKLVFFPLWIIAPRHSRM